MAITLKCVAKRMTGNQTHDAIAYLWWVKMNDNAATSEQGVFTREEMVTYIERNGDYSVWCPDKDPRKTGAWVRVQSNGRIKYVQTVADGRTTDNLLSLPDR